MRALTVQPGVPDSLQLETFRVPGPEHGAVLVRTIAIGICGTDRDIIAAKYGSPPPGHERLIIGHESLGRVVDVPAGADVAVGDLVMGIVRHPDPVPCSSCAVGEWDMCRNGRYTEHGIKGLDGFGAEFFRADPAFLVKISPTLGELGVLIEPASVIAKAWDHIEHIGRRAHWDPRCVLVTGAGPVGLLAALFAKLRGLDVWIYDHNTKGPKPALARDLGATYHSSAVDELRRDFDIVIEATGVPSIIGSVIGHTSPSAIVCLLGVSEPGDATTVDLGAFNANVVLGNRVIFGSVNANRRHYEAAEHALCAGDPGWLRRIITRRVPLDHWEEAFAKRDGDVKTIISLSSWPA